MRYFNVALLSLALTGCDIEGFIDSQRYKEDFRETRALKGGGRVTVENYNGSIEIAGWERDEVEISGTKYASTEDLLKEVKIDIAATPTSVFIRTIPPSERHGQTGAKYLIRVPRKVELDRVQSTNGSVRVADVDGAVRVRTSNGSVRTVNLAGDFEVQTTNGAVEARDVKGAATLRTSNGSVTAEGIRGGVSATTTNGAIRVQVLDAAPDRPMRLQTTNGSIDIRLDTPLKTDLRASSTNSGITLHAPSGLNAVIDASTTNSSVTTDFPLATSTIDSKKKIAGTIGSGGPRIDLSTTNGSIKVLKM